jgi:AcrR family transcriptional regulator
MANPATTRPVISGVSGTSPTRRERLLGALVDQVAQNGYQATTIARITAGARLSRTTFYEYFADKEDCFLAAHRRLGGHLTATIEMNLDHRTRADGIRTVLGTLVELAEREPTAALVLVREPAAAGPRALDERHRLLSSIEHAIEQARAGPGRAPIPGLPARALVGAAVRELAMRLHKQGQPGELLNDLVRWAEGYTMTKPTRWSPSRTTPSPPGPKPTSRGRPRLASRERIVRATAELAERHGYPQLTVAEIAAAAGVNRETFYQHFADKEAAYIAAVRLVFERAMAATAGAFFGPFDWTERVWRGAYGLVEFLASERPLARVGLSEPYALSREAADLIIDQQLAFRIFLEDGYQWQADALVDASRLTSNLIVYAIFELLDRGLREHPEESLTALIPQIAYIALAPFTGADAAGKFIERKLEETPPQRRLQRLDN